ncbi:MAG: ABC transporter permease [Sphingopyxis sp.]|uniref:ABC transporter permease n=1 Tax=Sphingopyxis sp. TaxID=1908224 RepID=UPI002ABBBA26|nr:ABC transporter permease [Sphingopyxis sp.]MDZ3832815.1 ABC transporter permease [Sphingopyxis sp.]
MIWQSYRATFFAIFSDRAVMLLLIGSAILYSFFYPAAYSGEVAERIPVVVVDNDHSATSRAFVQRVDAVQQARIAARVSSPAEALSLMQERRADAILYIPVGFERAILRGDQGTVALFGNGAFLLRSSTSLTGLGAALGAVGRDAAMAQAMARGAPAPSPFAVIARPLFNTREGYGSSIVPGVTFLIIQQTMLMGMAMLAATLREARGDHRFSPPRLLGIALAFFTVGWGVLAYWTGFVFWFQDYPRAGADGLTLIVSGTLFIAATVAAALALSSLFQVRERPVQLWIVTSLPIYFLANLSWPAEQTPHWLTLFARLLPTTPGIHLMIGTNQMGASLDEQWPELINLALLILLYGLIALWRLTPLNRSETAPPPRR